MTDITASMQWFVIITPLGSLIARANRDDLSQDTTAPIYDACTVVQRPSSVYVPKCILDQSYMMPEGSEPPIFDEQTYKQMQGIWIRPDIDEASPLVEIEGPLVTDYVPIRPSQEVSKTVITLKAGSIVYFHPLDRYHEVQEYIDKIMGRSATKKIDVTDDMLADLDRISASKQPQVRRDSGDEGQEFSLHGIDV